LDFVGKQQTPKQNPVVDVFWNYVFANIKPPAEKICITGVNTN
jgi:hypothetical protein